MLSCLSRVQLFATPWTVALQAPLSMGFSRQEYWSGLLFPPPGDLSNPGIEPESLVLQVDSLPLSHQGSPKYCIRDRQWQHSSTEAPGCPAPACPDPGCPAPGCPAPGCPWCGPPAFCDLFCMCVGFPDINKYLPLLLQHWFPSRAKVSLLCSGFQELRDCRVCFLQKVRGLLPESRVCLPGQSHLALGCKLQHALRGSIPCTPPLTRLYLEAEAAGCH